jgi:hypothetical protein
MVMAVFRRPPLHALLRRTLRHRGEHKLEHTAGRIRPMREVAMVPGADGEHARPIEDHGNRDRLPGDAGPEGTKTGEVHQNEGN